MVDELTGIYAVTARLATGRTLDYAGTYDEYTGWLYELRSVETIIDLDVHELTEAEVDDYSQVYDGPCSDGEPGA